MDATPRSSLTPSLNPDLPPASGPQALQTNAQHHLQAVLHQLAGPQARPRGDQVDAVQALLPKASRVLLVQATGWGKSAVYWAATRALRAGGAGPTLVISPLLALMRDQIAAAQRAGLQAASVNSTNLDEWDAVFERLDAQTLDVLLVSPERLGNPRFAARLGQLLSQLGLIVIDEAHCISDWGFDFRPDYQRLARALLATPTASVLATTATANERVTRDIGRQLGTDCVTFRGTLARSSLTLSVVPGLSSLQRYAWIADALERLPGSGIVYVLTVAEAERLSAFLRSLGHEVRAYSGQSDTDGRLHIEEQLRHNQIKAVVATSALGMGYDKPDLGFCLHVGSPATPVAYYQQVGRAGRGLTHAEGVLLPSDADERIWDYFASASIPDPLSAQRVLACLADGPMSVVEIEAQTGLRRGRLEALLKILAVDGVVNKVASQWHSTGRSYVHDSAKWAALQQVRRAEADLMRQYARGQACLMAYLQTALDDPHPSRCGRCSVCTARLPHPGLLPSPDKELAARNFLRGFDTPIEPRRRWPLGAQRKGSVRAYAAGRAVAYADDPAWSMHLQALHHGPAGQLPEPLLEGAIATLARWSKVWAARPSAVVPLPAPDMGPNRLLAEHIARKGRLPLNDALQWNGPAAPQEVASSAEVSHLEQVLALRSDSALPAGPLLLVSTQERSRWCASLAATMLRENGAHSVLLLVLHLRP